MKKIFKRKISLLLSFIMITGILQAPVAAEPAENYEIAAVSSENGRDINFNKDWKFYLGTSTTAQNVNFNDSGWETVSIPHDFSIFQEFTTNGTEVESGYLPGGTGWYRKYFTVEEADEGKSFTISFDGAYNHTYVYINGTYVGENHYGYNSFAFDITDELIYGEENVIAVKVVHELFSSRWYSGSGIYRDVTLTVTDPVHVALNGTYVTTPDLAGKQNSDVRVCIETEVLNDGSAAVDAVLRHTLLASNGNEVSEPVETDFRISPEASSTVQAELYVYAPALWSVETPNLYQVKTEVIVEGNVTDTYYTDYGFRYFNFDANTGFSLNGEAMKLKGVCLHHDQGALGAAAYNDAMRRQLVIMKDMGCNAIRTSHNIADKDFIRMCNEMGFLVMEEAFDGWSAAKNGNTHDFSEYFNTTIAADNGIIGGRSGETWVEFTLKSMVLRDRNEPSIIMWDIGNEITNIIGNGSTSQYPTYCSNMISWVQSLDMTRPITHGDNNGAVKTTSTGVTAKVDRLIAESGGVVGFNYYVSQMGTTHKNYPNWKLVATETVSSINSRGAYNRYNSSSSLYQSSNGPYVGNAYDNYCVFWGTTAHDGWYQVITNDFISGEFFWTGFDYIGEPTPWWRTEPKVFTELGAAPNSSYFGAVDTAGFPKDKYYFYRSQWNEKDTTLHLVTAWDSDNQYLSSGKTPVWIYTNAPKVELYRVDNSGNTVKLATSTRVENTTSAGYCYGKYTTNIDNSTYCQVITTSGASALSARVNVAYTDGSIYAVAYDQNGNVIENTVGNARVNTPGNAARIDAYADKYEMAADGYSLSYITMDVTDADGNLDTAADHRIEITLEGNGEIVGVDNGNPATLRKYQQPSVLTSAYTANIDAYAGKALVIVRSTEHDGGFTVYVTSDSLEGDEVTVQTYSVGCEPEAPDPEPVVVPVEAVILNEEKVELLLDEAIELEAQVLPEEATDKKIVWESSDEEVAVVDDGIVTAVGVGEAFITAYAGECFATCKVIVEEPYDIIPVDTVYFKNNTVELLVDDTMQLEAVVLPEDATNKEITWTSSDESVVTVTEDGYITAVGYGEAIVTAMAEKCLAGCYITVKEPVVDEKTEPTVTLSVQYKNSKFVVTAQSDIGVNPDAYYKEIKHGILYIPTTLLGSRNLIVTTSGKTNKVINGFEEDGIFKYSFKPLAKSLKYAFRAYVYYEKDDGSRIYAYSPVIKGSGTTLAK